MSQKKLLSILPAYKSKDNTVGKQVYSNEFHSYNLDTLRNIAILLLLINSVVNYFSNLYYSFFITASSCLLLFASIFFNTKKHFFAVRMLNVFLLCMVVLCLTYAEGLASGDYLYIFVFIIGSIFIYDTTHIRSLLIELLAILFSLIFIFLFAPVHSTIQRIDLDSERGMFAVNVFTSAFITCLLAYLLIKRNYENEQALKDKQQFLNTVYNTSSDAVFIAEAATGAITDCNENSATMFAAANKKDIIGKEVQTFFATENNEAFKRLFFSREIWKGELNCIAENGIQFPVYATIVPFYYTNVWYNKVSVIDITDVKKAQIAITEAKEKAEEAVAAKSRFLSNMSHELRTPLNGIIGTANLLEYDSTPAEQERNIKLLRYSSEHMLNLINDILDFSKFEAGKVDIDKKEFNLKETINHVAGIFAGQFHKKKVALNIICDDRVNHFFYGDETRLKQVLVNLIGNALKFTEKGFVTIEVKQLSEINKKASVYFAITDTGVGIPQGKKEIIFESFTQADVSTNRKFGGTGLGLAISKKIVDAHGGKLEVKSEYGVGSRFYFTVQLDKSNKENLQLNTVAKSNFEPLPGLRVLIAEDNPINMMIARKFLKLWQVELVEAKNGFEALERYGEGDFDIVLIDLDMPGMDGFELIQRIRAADTQIPAVAFTAAVYDNMEADLFSKGFTDYLQKPFRPEELHRKLTTCANAVVLQ